MRWPWQPRHDRDLFQIGSIVPTPTYAAVPVNPTTAMQHSAVWACVNLIAGSISTLPLAAYRTGQLEPLSDLPPILRAPSAGWSLPDFLYAALQSLLVRGNCYGLIVDRAGALIGILSLDDILGWISEELRDAARLIDRQARERVS